MPNIGAFVIFNRFEDKENLAKTYTELNKSSLLCKKKIWPEKHLF